jgi:hypothetical protein
MYPTTQATQFKNGWARGVVQWYMPMACVRPCIQSLGPQKKGEAGRRKMREKRREEEREKVPDRQKMTTFLKWTSTLSSLYRSAIIDTLDFYMEYFI